MGVFFPLLGRLSTLGHSMGSFFKPLPPKKIVCLISCVVVGGVVVVVTGKLSATTSQYIDQAFEIDECASFEETRLKHVLYLA